MKLALLAAVFCLLVALVEARARHPFTVKRGFWLSKDLYWRTLKRLADLGRWRTICPDCKGTGICQRGNSRNPHSCCGECERQRVPWSSVPSDFDGHMHDEFQRANPNGVLIGVGWVWGSFWQGLRRGFYRGGKHG